MYRLGPGARVLFLNWSTSEYPTMKEKMGRNSTRDEDASRDALERTADE